MSDLQQRYPLSTADGKAIPLDIVCPHGVIKKSFISTGSTAALTCPSTVEVMSFLTTEDCIVKFAASGASAAALVDGSQADDVVFIPAEILVVISPPVGKKSFALRGDTANGTAVVQFYKGWSGLSLQAQNTRR